MYEWQKTRRVFHPAFPDRTFLVLAYIRGRWVPQVLQHPNGSQEEGLEALTERNLCLADPFHPIPRLVEK